MLGLGPGHKILALALTLEVSALNVAALALWVKSYLHTMARNKWCRKDVYSNWYKRGQQNLTSQEILKLAVSIMWAHEQLFKAAAICWFCGWINISQCCTHTHTHTRLTALCPGLLGWAGTRQVKPIWILLKQETVSGSGISWAICKSAPRSRQITTPAPTTQFFTGRMPFLPPNQQRQSTEGKKSML